MKPTEIIEPVLLGLTMVGTWATAIIILMQARLLRLQNQLQALIQLNEAWESVRMNGLRARWAANDRDLESAEEILEFLEEFAGLRARHVLDNALVWDSTIGWHATPYYFYNRENGNIGRLRAKWLDETLYRNLDVMWRRYVRIEQKERADIDEKNLEQQIIETRGKFLTAEQARDANRISDGVN